MIDAIVLTIVTMWLIIIWIALLIKDNSGKRTINLNPVIKYIAIEFTIIIIVLIILNIRL